MVVRRIYSRGFSLIYATIAMTAMLGIISLAVDLGRVQLAKTQLRQAADAASRYAVMGISDGTYLTKAQAAASDNLCDGGTITLLGSDVSLGRFFDGTFSVGGTPTNAVQVIAQRTAARGNPIALTCASLIGRSFCDVTAVSITRLASSGGGLGMVGVNAGTISTSGTIDSYNSDLADYSYKHYQNGDVGSNGTLTLAGGAQVNGDAYYVSAYAATGGAAVVSPGAVMFNSTPPTYTTPTLPPSYVNYGPFTAAGGTYPVAPGNYYFTTLNVTGNVSVSSTGPVNIYVGGPISINGSFSPTSNKPGNLKIMTVVATTVSLTNTGSVSCDLYCPNSAVTLGGTGDFYGRAVGQTLTTSGSFKFHYDEALTPLSSGSISLVK